MVNELLSILLQFQFCHIPNIRRKQLNSKICPEILTLPYREEFWDISQALLEFPNENCVQTLGLTFIKNFFLTFLTDEYSCTLLIWYDK